MVNVYVRFQCEDECDPKKHSYEPRKWHKIISENIAWPELDAPRRHRSADTRSWRERISRCWLSEEYLSSLNLEVDLAKTEMMAEFLSELAELMAVFLSATEINYFIPPPHMNKGPMLATFWPASGERKGMVLEFAKKEQAA